MLGLRQAFRDPAGLVQALRQHGPFESAGAFPRLGLRGLAAEASNGTKAVVEKEMKGAAKTAGHWLSDFLKAKGNVLIAGAGLLLAINLTSKLALDWYYQRQVVGTLRAGVLPPPGRPALLPREALRRELLSLLSPAEPTRFYHIVTGPPGSGKTTLLREACAAMGGGVGFVDVPPAFEEDWGRDLGNTFNFRFEEHLTLFNIVSQALIGSKLAPEGRHRLSSLRRSAEALHSAASEFRRRTGRPFVLVIDSVDRLARGGDDARAALAATLEYARDWAQEGVVTTLFVASSWRTVAELEGSHPTQSRSGPRVVVGPITEGEAAEYARALGLEGKLVDQCVGLVGGSLPLLERCAGLRRNGLDFAGIKERLLSLMDDTFQAAGLLDESPQREGGLAVVDALLASKERCIPASTWRDKLPAREHQEELTRSGVFHFDGKEVRFGSNLAAFYAAEELHGRLPPSPLKAARKKLL